VHRLDHAKINYFAKSAKRAGSQAYTLTEDNQPGLAESLDLSKLVEEVVEGIYNGHRFATGRTQPNSHPTPKATFSPVKSTLGSNLAREGKLFVILDIEKRSSWVFNTLPGAWRRIVMNLFGNALKYTDAGFIRVALRAINMPSTATGSQQTMIELRVSDTGRGISVEYMKHRL
jgi:signal transduction histidine kinase